MRVIATEVLFDGVSLRQPGDLFEMDDKIIAADKAYQAKNPSAVFPYKPASKKASADESTDQIA